MNTLSDKELNSISGGAIRIGAIGTGVGAGIVFLIGLISGLTRPYSCSSNK